MLKGQEDITPTSCFGEYFKQVLILDLLLMCLLIFWFEWVVKLQLGQ